ncbi:MAG: gliding motility lipoprotein GldH [Bacteroidales bacterium]
MKKAVLRTCLSLIVLRLEMVLLISLLAFSACSFNTDIFHTFNDIPQRGWDKRNIQKFIPRLDLSTSKCDIAIEINYNNDYNYRNLYLFITAEDGSRGILFKDTLNCVLADEYGKWLGSGWGSSYQQSFKYKSDYDFPSDGTYYIYVTQGMRDDVIDGIERVGVKISRAVVK